MTVRGGASMPDALSVVLHAAMLSSSSMALQLCAAVVKGQAAWEEEVQQQCKNAQQTGQVNLAALLHLLENDVLSSTQCYRASGCLREALAVASARLLPCDPAGQQLRRDYAASIAPCIAPAAHSEAAPTAAAAAAAGSNDTATAPATSKKKFQFHPEAAAANLLLVDEPAAAARVLASGEGDCSGAVLHAAARVAALAAAHKTDRCQQELCFLAAQYALHACLLRITSSSSSSGPAQQHSSSQQQLLLQDMISLLQPLVPHSGAVSAVVLVLSLATHLEALLDHTISLSQAAAAAAAGASAAAAAGASAAAAAGASAAAAAGASAAAAAGASAAAGGGAAAAAGASSTLASGSAGEAVLVAAGKQGSSQLELPADIEGHPTTSSSSSSTGRCLLLQELQPSQVQSAMQLLLLAVTNTQQQQDGQGPSAAAGAELHAELLQDLQRVIRQLPSDMQQQLQSAGVHPPGTAGAEVDAQQQQAAAALGCSVCCCVCGALCLWCALLPSKATGCEPASLNGAVEAAWQQHTLSLLLSALKQQQQHQQQQQQQQPIPTLSSIAAEQAVPTVATVVLTHPKQPGQRQQYSMSMLHALSRTPLLVQLQQQQQQDIQQQLRALDVPVVRTAPEAAAVATSIKTLLPGHRPVAMLAHKAPSSSGGRRPQQQHKPTNTYDYQQQQQQQHRRGKQQQQHSGGRGRRQQQQQQHIHPYDMPLMDAQPVPPPQPPPPQQQQQQHIHPYDVPLKDAQPVTPPPPPPPRHLQQQQQQQDPEQAEMRAPDRQVHD